MRLGRQGGRQGRWVVARAHAAGQADNGLAASAKPSRRRAPDRHPSPSLLRPPQATLTSSRDHTSNSNISSRSQHPPAMSSSGSTPGSPPTRVLLPPQDQAPRIETHPCLWVGCDKVAPDPETLYMHLCNECVFSFLVCASPLPSPCGCTSSDERANGGRRAAAGPRACDAERSCPAPYSDEALASFSRCPSHPPPPLLPSVNRSSPWLSQRPQPHRS